MYVAIINLIVLATFAASAFLVAAPLTQSQTDPGYVPPSTVESFSQQAQNIDSSALSGTDSQKQEDKPQECLNSYPLYNAYSVEAMQEKALDKASGGKRKCFELRYKPDNKPTTDSQALQDAGNQINSTGNCTYGVCTGDAPSNYSNQNYDSAYDTPTNNTPSAFEAFSQQAQNIDPNALQQNGYFSEGAAPNAYFQGPEAQQDTYTTNADGTYTLRNSDPRREELYRAAETIANYEANKGLLGNLKESLVGEPDYVTEARRIVALNTVEPAETVPVQVVDKDGNSKIINLPGNLKVDGSPYTLGQQYAAAQKTDPLMGPVLGNAEGLAAKIDQYSNIKGIALTDTNGNTAEIPGVTSFSKVITAMQQEPQEFANVKQVNLAPGDTSITPTPPPQTPVIVSMAQPTDTFKTTEIASRPLSDSFPAYSAPSNDVPLNVAGNSGAQGAQTGANQGGTAQPPVQTANAGNTLPKLPWTPPAFNPAPVTQQPPAVAQPPLTTGPTFDGQSLTPPPPKTTMEKVGDFLAKAAAYTPFYVGPANAGALQRFPEGLWPAANNPAFRGELASGVINNVFGMKRSNEFLNLLAQNPNIQLQQNQKYAYTGFASHADAVAGLLEKLAKQSAYANCTDYNCILQKYLGPDALNGAANYKAHLERTGLSPNFPKPQLTQNDDLNQVATLVRGISNGEYKFNQNPLTDEVLRDGFSKVYGQAKADEWYNSVKGTSGTARSNTPSQQAAAQQATQKIAELADQMAKAVDGNTDSLNKGLADAAKQAAEQMSRAGSGGITPSQAEQIAKELAQAAEDTAKKLGEGGNEIAKELAQSLAKEAENAAQALTGPSKAGGPTGGSGNKALDDYTKSKGSVSYSDGKTEVPGKTAAGLPPSKRNELKVSGKDGKDQGTFKDYMAAEQTRAQAAVDNDARAKQLDSMFGSGHQVSGTGQSRPVTRNGQPAGSIENMTKEQAALAAAAQARGIKPVFKDGKVFDGKGRQLQLVTAGKKTSDAAPRIFPVNNFSFRGKNYTGKMVKNPTIPTRSVSHNEFVQAMKDAGVNVVDNSHRSNPGGKNKMEAWMWHGSEGSGKNLATYCSRMNNAGKPCTQAILHENGTLEIIAPLDSRASHAPSMRHLGPGVEIARADDGVKETAAQLDTVKKMNAVMLDKFGWTVGTHGQAEVNRKHSHEGGDGVVAATYGTGGPTEVNQYQLVAISQQGDRENIGGPVTETELPSSGQITYYDTNGKATTLEDVQAGKVTVTPALNPDGSLGLKYAYTGPTTKERDTRTTQPERRTPWQNVKAGWQRFTGQQPYQGPATGSRPMTPGGTRPMTPSSRPLTPSPSVPLTPSTPNPTATTPTASLACFPDPVVATGETQYVRAIWSCSGAASSIGGTKEQGLSATLNTGGALAGVGDITLTPAFLNATSTSNKLTFGVACRATSGQTVTKTCSVDLLKPELVLVATPKVATPGESVNLRWNSFKLSTSTKEYPCTVFGPDETVIAEGSGSGEVTLSPLTRSSEFILMCDSDGGPVFKSTTVTVEGDTAAPEKVDLPYVTIDAVSGLIRPTKAYTPLPDDLCHPYLGTKKYTACVTTNET